METYYQHVIFLTGLTAVMAMLPAMYFYRQDRVQRIAGGVWPRDFGEKLKPGEIVLLLVTGAGLAQYGNIIVNILNSVINYTAYQESMEKMTDGKGIFMMIFWMGIIAPAAEEMIFRWLVYLRLRDYLRVGAAVVISAVMFGMYHGNIVQAIYASLLGAAFAYILEKSKNLWSSVCLHIGANVWSLLLGEYGVELFSSEKGARVLLLIYMLLLIIMVYGLNYFGEKSKRKSCVAS